MLTERQKEIQARIAKIYDDVHSIIDLPGVKPDTSLYGFLHGANTLISMASSLSYEYDEQLEQYEITIKNGDNQSNI